MKFTPISLAILSGLTVFATQAEVYQAVELGNLEGFKSSFSATVNNNNQSVGTVSGRYNFPVDLSSIDYTNALITNNLTTAQIEEVKKGNVDAQALTVLLNYLQSASFDHRVQRYTDAYAYRYDLKQQVLLRETRTPQTNYEYLTDINDSGWMAGFAGAPFVRQAFTPAPTEAVPNPVVQQLWVPQNAFVSGVVIAGEQRHVLAPVFGNFGGGITYPTAMNNTNTVVGISSLSMAESMQTSMNTACDNKAEPKEICYFRTIGSVNKGVYGIGGVKWSLDASGKPGAPVALGLLGDKKTGLPHTKTDYTIPEYRSTPEAVNDAGIIVGNSVYTNSDELQYNPFTFRDDVVAVNQAVIFQGNELLMITDPKVWGSSTAADINNKNIVVGTARETWYQGPDKFFVYDMASQKLTLPKALFSTASSSVAAINNNNIVVGTTEVFYEGSATKRQTAFWYDIATDTFRDLNTMLPCNSAYRVVSATDINDKNVIVATAVKQVDRRDIKGELVKDSAGNVLREEVAIAIQLNPVPNGVIDDCSAGKEQGYERKGGPLSPLWFALLGLLWFRRR